MAMPPATALNTTCDIYRNGNAPPAAPDVAGVPCYIAPAFANIKVNASGFTYDHVVSLSLTADVRDDFPSSPNGDTLWLPNQHGVPYLVQFVERVRLGLAGGDYKRAYVLMQTPTWPATDL
jgi:hypothetical protein